MRTLALATAMALAATPILGQEPGDRYADGRNTTPGQGLIDLGINRVGVSIGNSAEWTGLRLNWRDRGIRRLTGVNLSIWIPDDGTNHLGTMAGLNVGLAGPNAGRLHGVSLGLGAVAEREAVGLTAGVVGMVVDGDAWGVSAGGIGAVINGAANGLALGGLGTVVGDARGVSLGGLAVVSGGELAGIAAGGLAVVSGGGVEGLGVGGLAMVAGEGLSGVGVGGLAMVSGQSLTGVGVGGLATVAGEDLTGVGVGLLAVVAGSRLRGGAVALGGVSATEALGLTAAAWVKVRRMEGVTVGGYNHGVESFRGLMIGLFNSTPELHGVQVGLLNHAGNNRGIARWLPLVNVHLE